MKKKLIRITESDLHRIINESVCRMINEGYSGSACEGLESVQNILSDIMNSGFIPFSSPSPSSTEKQLKDTIIGAYELIDKAIHLCWQLGYSK